MSELSEADFGTAFYRSRDPIKNLKISVQLNRVTSTNIIPQVTVEKEHGTIEMREMQRQALGGQRDMEEYVFRWQEKLLGKREVDYYSLPENCETVTEKKYHDDAIKFKERGRPTRRIFSHTENDAFTNREENVQRVTTSPNEEPTQMAVKMTNIRQRKGGGSKPKPSGYAPRSKNIVEYKPSEELKKKNHLLSTAVQTMYIMADLTPEGKEPTENDEFVLCTIKADANGVISIRPDFNKGRKGYKIEAAGMGRDLFEYAIEHSSHQLNRQEQEKETRMLKELYNRHAEFLQACVGHDFELPPTDMLKVIAFGEIESAKNFEDDHLYVSYFLDLPNGWYSARPQQLSGVTQTCTTKNIGRDEVAYFSLPFSFELVYKPDSSTEHSGGRWPMLYLEVSSMDTWQRHRCQGYGYMMIPSNVGRSSQDIPCWRPQGRSVVSELRRFFIGGNPELEDPTYAAVPSTFEGKHLGKFGFRTVSTGIVTIKLNMMQQSQTFLQTHTSKKKMGHVMDRLGKSAAQVNIMNVLEGFQRAKKRMILARDNLKKEYIETLKALEVEENAQ